MAGNSWTLEYAKQIMQGFRDQVIEISSGLPCSQVCRQKVKKNCARKHRAARSFTLQITTGNVGFIYMSIVKVVEKILSLRKFSFRAMNGGKADIEKNILSFLVLILSSSLSLFLLFCLCAWKQKKSWKRMDGQLLAMKETGSGGGHVDCYSLQCLILGLNHS